MIKLDIEQDVIPKESRLKQRAFELLEQQFQEAFPDVDGVVSLRFVIDLEIKKLNRMYRDKDTVTDVLSFGYLDDKDRSGNLLGDVVISFDQAERQADGDTELELIDLMTHGILHVLGHDHERPEDAKEMFPIQDKIVNYVISQKVL